jgi:hypothetical protein
VVVVVEVVGVVEAGVEVEVDPGAVVEVLAPLPLGAVVGVVPPPEVVGVVPPPERPDRRLGCWV